MNKHTRLAVTLLFAVLLIFTSGFTQSYFGTSVSSDNSSETVEIIRKLDADENGTFIFESSSGLYGIADSNNTVVAAPEWSLIKFTEGQYCIASKYIGETLLTGCIDYDGNISVPFIYSGIKQYRFDGITVYAAKSDSDDSYVLYDEDFNPLFMRSWDSCSVSDNSITLSDDTGTFVYTGGEKCLIFKRADVNGSVFGTSFQLSVYSRLLLSKLDCNMLESMVSDISDYMEYALTDDKSYISGFNTNGFLSMYPEDEKIISRSLTGISDIFILAEKNENGEQYYTATVSVETDIEYTDDSGAFRTAENQCQAVLKFVQHESELTAVSGTFTKSVPDYTAEVDNTDTENDITDNPEILPDLPE